MINNDRTETYLQWKHRIIEDKEHKKREKLKKEKKMA
jgi:hypothetical protein